MDINTSMYVRIKNNYGTPTYYPACEQSKKFATLVQCTTLPPWAIKIIKELGYEVLVVKTEPDKL
jgi:hypothetical protein